MTDTTTNTVSEKEKLFNLQLTVQKLEEELSLYRNGITNTEILEIIKEKDNEIAELKSKVTMNNETLRKLAKSSTDVLEKYNQLVTEKTVTDAKYTALFANYNSLTDSNNQQLRTNNELTITITQLQQQLADKTIVLDKYNNEIVYSNSTIEKLQKRCAELVAERTEKTRLLDQEKLDMIKQVEVFRESMKASLQQRDSVIKRQEQTIRELEKKISVPSPKQIRSAPATPEESAARQEQLQSAEYWEAQAKELENKLSNNKKYIRQLEHDKRTLQLIQMEYEDLKAKLSTEKDGYHIPVGGTTTVTVNTNSCDDTKNIKTSRILKNSNSATVSNNGGNSVATVTKTKATVSSPIQENRNSPMNSPSTLLVSQRAPQLMEPTIKTITNDTLTVDSNSNTVATVAYKPKYR